MVVASTFWDAFFLMLIWIPLLLIWSFALVDIFRREDISGVWKAIWVVCVIALPFFGTLIYLISRPSRPTGDEPVAIDPASYGYSNPHDPTAQLKTLAELHDRGKLTDAEFASEKARVLKSA